MVTCPEIETPAANCTKVFLDTGHGILTLFFSYSTCIGFRSNKHGYVFTAEQHSRTTARHMSGVFNCSKEDKVPAEEFTAKLQEALNNEC